MMSKSKTHIFTILDILTILALCFLVLMLLTNALPLAQAGLIADIKSKTRCGNLIRIPAILFFSLFCFAKFSLKDNFSHLKLIRLWERVNSSHASKAVMILWLIYAISGTATGITRHSAFETRAFDLGIFDQAIWNTLRGDWLFSSIKDNICLLGDHFSPILFLLTPFYALWQDPRNLILLQSLALSCCIPLVYRLANDTTRDHKTALCFAIAFFLFFPERSSLHEDFHPEVLTQALIFVAYMLMIRGKTASFVAVLAVILSAKENFAGILFIFGVYLSVFDSRKKLGIGLMVFSILYLLLITHWIIPMISGKPYLYQGLYRHIYQSPAGFISYLLSPESVNYVFKLFSPLLFLSFLHPPTLLLTVPVLLQNLISENPVNRSFGYHYTAGLSPFVFISAIMGWTILMKRNGGKGKGWILSGLILMSILRSGPSEYFYFSRSFNGITEEKKEFKAVLSNIPSHETVLTHNNIIPQISHRKFIYQFEHNFVPSKLEQALAYDADKVIFAAEFWEPKSKDQGATLEEFREAGYVETFRSKSGKFLIYTRLGK